MRWYRRRRPEKPCWTAQLAAEAAPRESQHSEAESRMDWASVPSVPLRPRADLEAKWSIKALRLNTALKRQRPPRCYAAARPQKGTSRCLLAPIVFAPGEDPRRRFAVPIPATSVRSWAIGSRASSSRGLHVVNWRPAARTDMSRVEALRGPPDCPVAEPRLHRVAKRRWAR